MKKVKLIRKKEFGIVIFDPNHIAFIVYIYALNINSGKEVYCFQRA